MKLGAIALDYDGTTRDLGGSPHRRPRGGRGSARVRGVAVLLVTGRRLPELEREVGDLRLFDAVVAENGALVSFPTVSRTRRLGAAPPPEFLARLTGLGVPFETGECVIEAGRRARARRARGASELELPLVLQFNRGRLMSAAAGDQQGHPACRTRLAALRLSPHNTMAIGDAENDREMLRTAEVGVAVARGSAELKRAADLVLEGAEPADVAAFVRRAVNQKDVLPARPSRRTIAKCHRRRHADRACGRLVATC